MKIKSILSAVALSLSLVVAVVPVAQAKPVYDTHGTEVHVSTRAEIRDIWNNFNTGGMGDVMHTHGFNIIGLEGMTFDSKNRVHEFTTIENRTVTNILPKNWVQLMYIPKYSDESPSVFANINEKGVIHVYMPGAAKF